MRKIKKTIIQSQVKALVHTVSFNSNGGTSISEIKIAHGNKIPDYRLNNIETAKGIYIFYRWHLTDTLDSPWDISTDIVTSDIALYAEWLEPGEQIYDTPGTYSWTAPAGGYFSISSCYWWWSWWSCSLFFRWNYFRLC